MCFKPLSAGDFVRAENDLQQLLDVSPPRLGPKLERREDSFGFTWVVVHDPDLEDGRRRPHGGRGSRRTASGAAARRGLRFDGGKGPVYWIYGYKRGAFWPFVPTGEGQERDNAEELELKAKLEKELPIEPDLEPLVRRLRRLLFSSVSPANCGLRVTLDEG